MTTHQTNKSFKSKHKTKSAIKKSQGGKVESLAKRQQLKSKTKSDKKNELRQLQQNKKAALLTKQRLYKDLKKIVLLLPLSPGVLFDDINISGEFQVINCQDRNIKKIIDALSVVDFVVFGLSQDNEVDQLGMLTLNVLRSFGIPSAPSASVDGSHYFVSIITDSTNDKQLPQVKKSLLQFMEQELGGSKKDHKLFCSFEVDQLSRVLKNMLPTPLKWKQGRPYMLIEDISFQDTTLVLEGVNRGTAFNVNNLVHLKVLGDFQLDKIELVDSGVVLEPNADQQDLVHENFVDPMSLEQTWPTEEEMADGERVTQEHLQKTVHVPKGTSPYVAAWLPSDEEAESMSEAESVQLEDRVESGDEDQASEGELEKERQQFVSRRKASEELDLMAADEHQAKLIADYKEMKEYLKYPDEVDPLPAHMKCKERYAKYRGLPNGFLNSVWDPYENLPVDYGRIFQFGNDEHDKYESIKQQLLKQVLQEDISKNSMDVDSQVLAYVGARVKLFIKNVPVEAVQKQIQQGQFQLGIFGMLPFEQKMSVMHMTMKRPQSARLTSDAPNAKLKPEDRDFDQELLEHLEHIPVVKSKDEFLVISGYRQYTTKLLFSQLTRQDEAAALQSASSQKKLSNKPYMSKFNRFVGSGAHVVASCYAPVTFGSNVPVLYFQPEAKNDLPVMVGSGTSIRPNANRIIIKRKILTGHPSRIAPSRKAKRAVIRYMFSNRDDVDYFSPLPLRTQMNRKGNFIRSSHGLYDEEGVKSGAAVGYKGAYKAQFDKQLKSWDVVMLDLYKRVYPKWMDGYKSLFGSHLV